MLTEDGKWDFYTADNSLSLEICNIQTCQSGPELTSLKLLTSERKVRRKRHSFVSLFFSACDSIVMFLEGKRQ